MASLEQTTTELWAIHRPPLALLATLGCARAAIAGLSAEERAPYERLITAAGAWWPAKARPLREIAGDELAAILDAYGEHPDAGRLAPALSAAYHVVTALRDLSPGSLALPEIGNADALDGASLTKLVRQLAAQTHTDLDLWKRRFEHIRSFQELTGSAAAWPVLLDRTARMGFDRPMHGIKVLPKNLAELAKTADLGATWAWSMMGPKHALALTLGTTKRTAVLDEAQRTELIEALPWLV